MTLERFENGRRVIGRWDCVFEALSAEPRRQIVVSLLDSAPSQSVSLPKGAMNPNGPVAPDRLRRGLRHRHLPKLADPGFVEWDAEPLAVRRGRRFAEVAVVMEALQSNADEIPDALVIGCQRLEEERQFRT